ncbi:MAG: HigA family addiction module antitoxin [Opitutales bacterium]
MNTTINPHTRSKPSEILQDFIEEMEITQYRLAKDTCIAHATITKLIQGKARITVNIALRLSIFFGNTPQFWLNVQNTYDLYLLKKEQGEKIYKSVKSFELAMA